MLPSDLIRRFCVARGSGFRLGRIDPNDTCGLDIDKDEAKELLKRSTERLGELQERLHADRRWAVLVILQGMDASGKDGLIKHVLSGVNPQGCEVHAFAAPSAEELRHDFLWRTTVALPARGRIGIFNRSYYEETLVVRLHPEILARQNLPDGLGDSQIWKHRFEDIAAFERYLARNGVLVLKFFLHMSKEEQAKQLLERIDEADKHWKFQAGDLGERQLWDQYMHAYQETIRHTATPHAPWHVVPADKKWFTRLVVATTVVERMEALGLRYPAPSATEKRAMAKARTKLAAELPKDDTRPKRKPRTKRPAART